MTAATGQLAFLFDEATHEGVRKVNFVNQYQGYVVIPYSPSVSVSLNVIISWCQTKGYPLPDGVSQYAPTSSQKMIIWLDTTSQADSVEFSTLV